MIPHQILIILKSAKNTICFWHLASHPQNMVYKGKTKRTCPEANPFINHSYNHVKQSFPWMNYTTGPDYFSTFI